MNLINFKKYYTQLVSALIEKLSDSKVVIRQSILKCCSLIIQVNFILTKIFFSLINQVHLPSTLWGTFNMATGMLEKGLCSLLLNQSLSKPRISLRLIVIHTLCLLLISKIKTLHLQLIHLWLWKYVRLCSLRIKPRTSCT